MRKQLKYHKRCKMRPHAWLSHKSINDKKREKNEINCFKLNWQTEPSQLLKDTTTHKTLKFTICDLRRNERLICQLSSDIKSFFIFGLLSR